MIVLCRAHPRHLTPSTLSPSLAGARFSSSSAPEERAVGDIALALGVEQPSVSKHLQVLLNVGLVEMRRDGRRTLYRTNADALRPVHEWTGLFARYWGRQLRRIKTHAEAKEGKSS